MRRFSSLSILALLCGFVSSIAGPQAPITKPKPSKPLGYLEAMFADMTAGNRMRPIPDPDRFMERLGDLRERTEPELRTALQDLDRMRQIDGRNMQVIQRARQATMPRMYLDQPMYVARLYELSTSRQREIDTIDDEEEAAFKAAYGIGFSLKPGFFDPTPQQKEKMEAWVRSRRNEPFESRRAEVQERYRQRLEQVSNEYRNQTDPGEKNLDKLQREIMDRYQRLIAGQRRIRAELDRRHDVVGTIPPEKPNEARQGTLLVSAAKSKYDLKVGELADIDVTISGGKPPYRVRVSLQNGTTLADTTLSQPGQTSFPVSFPKEGNYTVAVSVEDETPKTRNVAILNLEFRVTDDRPAAPEPPKPPDPTKPQTPPKPPETTKPEAPPPYVPWVLAAGTYQAYLWPGYEFLMTYTQKSYDRMPFFPLTLQVGSDGTLAADVVWKLDPKDVDLSGLPAGSKVENEVKFRLTGKADWSTGKIDLKIVDGTRLETTIQPDTTKPGRIIRYDNRLSFAFEMTGWQIGHPRMVQALDQSLKTASRLYPKNFPKPLEKSDANYNHMPRFVRDKSGKYDFPDIGWCGIPDYPEKGNKFVGGPGGYSRPRILAASGTYTSPEFSRSYDSLETMRQTCENVSAWQLRIAGRKPPEPPPGPVAPSRPPIQGELAAFGLWPQGEMTAKPNEPFELDAMGVLMNDPYDAVNLNDRVTWNLPDGLSRGPDGRITASAPGTYTAGVSIRRPDGRTMSDTITIRVNK